MKSNLADLHAHWGREEQGTNQPLLLLTVGRGKTTESKIEKPCQENAIMEFNDHYRTFSGLVITKCFCISGTLIHLRYFQEAPPTTN